MKQLKLPVVVLALLAVILVGCAGDEEEADEVVETDEVVEADAMTNPTKMTATDTASVQEALGPEGSWIVLFEDDLTVSEPVTISGEVYEEAGAEAPRRKLALYAQDADRNVTARYTLTVPRLIVRHMNTRIQAGTVAGDVYVEAEGFELTSGATIDGDLYFASEELQESATIDESATVTGETGIGTAD